MRNSCRVFPETLAYGNSKKEIRQTKEEGKEEGKTRGCEHMKRSNAGTK